MRFRQVYRNVYETDGSCERTQLVRPEAAPYALDGDFFIILSNSWGEKRAGHLFS